MARGVGGGGDYSEEAIILNISTREGRLIEGRLLFEEIWYLQVLLPFPASPPERLGELARRLISLEKVFVRKGLKILTFFLKQCQSITFLRRKTKRLLTSYLKYNRQP